MFSVVIPLYNKELSISNTIQSVLNQTFQEFEIIIVNDGSTDNSVKRVEEFKDNRIRLIHQENQGVSAARNKGIKEAKYEWIALLDGDDLWKEVHLEEMMKMIKIYPDDKFFATSFKYSDDRKMFKHHRESSIFIVNNYFKEALKESLVSSINVVINKMCFEDIGLFNTNYIRGEDLDLWARIASKFDLVKSSEITSVYCIDAENRSNVKPVDVKSTFLGDLDFKTMKDMDEYNYYKLHVTNNLKSYIVKKQWSNVFYLLRKYWFEILKKTF